MNCNRTTQLTLCIISEILRLISCVKHHCGNYVCHVVLSTKHLLVSNFSPDVCLDTPIPLGVCHQTMRRGSCLVLLTQSHHDEARGDDDDQRE